MSVHRTGDHLTEVLLDLGPDSEGRPTGPVWTYGRWEVGLNKKSIVSTSYKPGRSGSAGHLNSTHWNSFSVLQRLKVRGVDLFLLRHPVLLETFRLLLCLSFGHEDSTTQTFPCRQRILFFRV